MKPMIYKKNTKENNKVKLIFLLVRLAIVIFAAVGLISFIVQNVNHKPVDYTKTSAYADRVKETAVKALNEDSKSAAKILFTKAHKLYEDLGDKDNMVYTETQLMLLEN